MTKFEDSIFEGELTVVATLAGLSIKAAVEELKQRDQLTVALRSALRYGADINDLSAASGLTVSDIRARVSQDLFIGEDLEMISGMR